MFEIFYRLPWKGEWMTKLAAYAFASTFSTFFLLVGYKVFGADMDKGLGFALAFFGSWAATWLLKRHPVARDMV